MEEIKLELRIRQFVLEAYASYQFLSGLNPEADKRQIALTTSQEIRSSLLRIAGDNDNELTELESKFTSLFRFLEKSLHVCEIFCIYSSVIELNFGFALWIKDGFCIPTVTFYDRLEQFSTSSHPEYIKNSNESSGYWDTIFSSLLQGDLKLACQLLILHSEISPYTEQLKSADFNSSETELSNIASDYDFGQCLALLRTILAHPFAEDIKNGFSSIPIDGISPAFADWRNRVLQLRGLCDRLPFLLRIPELDTVFRILLGDLPLLQQLTLRAVEAEGVPELGWTRLCLSLLLYVHPPPLSKPNISLLIQLATRTIPTVTVSSSRSLQDTLRDLMSGNALPVLQALLGEAEGGQILGQVTVGDALSNAVTDLYLTCTAHLTYLLVMSMDSRDLLPRALTLTSPPSQRGTTNKIQESFQEKVFLKLAERLHQSDYPLEVVLGYLDARVCPQQGSSVSRKLLLQQHISSDDDAIQVASALYKLRASDDARYVLLSRAVWWHSRLSSRSRGGKGDKEHRLEGFIKAVHFFSLAGDLLKVLESLETVWRGLLRVIRSCGEVFPGLTIDESTLGLLEVQGKAKKTVSEAGEDYSPEGYSEDPFEELTRENQNVPDRGRVSAALFYAERFLTAISSSELSQEAEGEQGEANNSIALAPLEHQLHERKEQLAKALQIFCEAITSLLLINATEATPEAEAKNPDQKAATIRLASILVPNENESENLHSHLPLVPLRLWLPIMEVIAWVQGKEEARVTKATAYRLLQLLQEALTFLWAKPPHRDTVEMLQKSTLSLLADAVIGENISSKAVDKKPSLSRKEMSVRERLSQIRSAHFDPSLQRQRADDSGGDSRKGNRRGAADYLGSNFSVRIESF